MLHLARRNRPHPENLSNHPQQPHLIQTHDCITRDGITSHCAWRFKTFVFYMALAVDWLGVSKDIVYWLSHPVDHASLPSKDRTSSETGREILSERYHASCLTHPWSPFSQNTGTWRNISRAFEPFPSVVDSSRLRGADAVRAGAVHQMDKGMYTWIWVPHWQRRCNMALKHAQ